ncbi:MAG: hypothetical protein JO232_05730 [Verrucomicrobia bacterium]|nr:hypothetical protein [Verrucomicrobiota bacterium]
MATSIQEFKGKTLMLNDLDLILVVVIILRLISKTPESVGLEHVAEHWKRALASYGPGVLDLELDKLMGAPGDVSSLSTLLSRIEAELAPYGGIVPASVLNDLVFMPGIKFADYQVQRIVTAGRLLREVLLT